MSDAKQPRLTDPRSFAFILVGTPLLILIALVTKSWASGRGETLAVGLSGVEECLGTVCASKSFKEIGAGAEVGAFAVLSIISGIAAMAAAGLFGGLVLANKQDKLPPLVLGHGAFGAAAFSMFFFAFRIGGADEVSVSWGPLFGLGGVGVGWYMLRRLQNVLPKRALYTPVVAGGSTGAMFGEAPAMSTTPASTSTAPAASAAPAVSPQPATAPAMVQQPMSAATATAKPATPVAAAAPAKPANVVPANQPTKCPKCKGPVDYIPQYQRSWCARCRQYA